MDLTGINNRNEYYTNTYFSSIFVETAARTISEWKNINEEEDFKTPWSKIKAIANFYAREREKLRNASEYKNAIFTVELAEQLIDALGYENNNSFDIELDTEKVPVYLEVKKDNGAPLLWILLATNDSKEDNNILETSIFDVNSVSDNNDYTKTAISSKTGTWLCSDK